MCDPITIMTIGAGVASAAGTVMSGYQSMQQGKMDAGIAKQNAAIEHESAAESLRVGGIERRKFWRDVGNLKGQQIASMAANGIDVDYGTAARIQDDTQLLANEDAQELYENIHQRTRGHIITSENYKMQAKAAKAAGKAAFASSLLSGAGTLLSSVSQAKSMKSKMGTSYAGGG